MQIQARENLRPAGRLLLLTDHDNTEEPMQMLCAEGFQVEHAYFLDYDPRQLVETFVDAVLIDLEHPSVQNVSFCQELRDIYAGPILILSVKTNDVLPVLGLEMGADDYLFKPQPGTLLLAKLRAFLRRNEEYRQQQREQIQLGELVVDAARREVWCSGRKIFLTAREFDLLWCLAKNARTIISRYEIHQELYNSEYNGFDRSIDIYISRIRQKIGDDPQNPRYLKTVRGAGYLLVENLS